MRVSRRAAVLFVSAFVLASCRLGPDESALVRASTSCDVDEVRSQLDRGWMPNDLDLFRVSAVAAAAEGPGNGGDGEGCLESLRVLQDAGGDVTRVVDGSSTLMRAAHGQQDPRVVVWLVDNGADPCLDLPADEKERHGLTTLVELAVAETLPDVASAFETAAAACNHKD